jgi:signal transduction histidine kinase
MSRVTLALSSAEAVAKIFHVIPDLATPPQVQESLREILDDPTLELAWWDWEAELYVDVYGIPTELAGDEARAVTLVGYESRKIGVIAHDPVLLDWPEFLHSFVPAMRIAMERDRLHRDLTAKLDQLKASRQRLIETAEAERRRLERNLHDGAQQRLVVTLLQLRGLESRLGESADGAAVKRARVELEAAIADLRELARGLHPPLLTSHGLEAAVHACVAGSSLPVSVDIRLACEVPPTVGAAAYYVCAEALANVAKHARAANVWLELSTADGALLVEVRDDGIGGASPHAHADSTGLRGLRDRVEALDGALWIESNPGAGTRLVAKLPLSS